MASRFRLARVACALALVACLGGTAHAAWPIDLIVENPNAAGFNALPVTSGVPLSRGHVTDLSQLAVLDPAGNPVPAQFIPLMTYTDGTPRWVLVDFQPTVAAGMTATYKLVRNQVPPEHPTPIYVTDALTSMTIDTGAATFVINKLNFNLFDSVTVGGVPIVQPNDANGIVVTRYDGSLWNSKYGPATVTIEDSGPLHVVVKVVGDHRRYQGDGAHQLEYTVRIHFYAGQSFVRVFHTLENRKRALHPGNRWDAGQGGYEDFKDLSLQLRTTLGEAVTYTAKGDSTSGLLTGLVNNQTYLYQCSSGGAKWDHDHHMDRNYVRYHQYPDAFRGWRLINDGTTVASGNRAIGWMDFADGAKGVALGVRHFWQNCPKAVEINGHDVIIRPFPIYQQGDHGYEFEGGQHKTHECFLYFHAGAGNAEEVMTHLNNPLFARCTAAHYADTYAFEYLGGPSTAHPRLENYINGVINAITSDWENWDEYGWEDFGDIVADHEHGGLGNSWWNANGINHYGNEYFATEGCMIQFARRGDLRFLEQNIVQSRHMIDIHIYHTTEISSDPAYAGGYFMHTTHDMPALRARHRVYPGECDADFLPQLNQSLFPGCPNDIWAPQYESGGPADPGHLNTPYYYFFMTGDREAYDGILTTAAWALRANTPTSRGREAGNFLFNLLYAYELTHDAAYLTKFIQTVNANKYNGSTGWSTAWNVDAQARFILWKRLNAEFDAYYTTVVNSLIGWSTGYLNNYTADGSYWRYHDFDALCLLYLSLPEYHANRSLLLAKIATEKTLAENQIPSWFQAKDLSVLLNSGAPHMFMLEGRLPPSIPGDVDHDGEISVLDVVAAVTAFGSTPDDGTWNAEADVDHDEQISVLDIVKIVISFGQKT